jgi:D-psicose/D-tagatose/L-ribulose 3-epimerase
MLEEVTPVREIGVNTWVWCSPPTDARLDELIPRIGGFGFDLVELPVEQLGDWSPVHVRDLLDDEGLGVSLCAVMPPGRELVAAPAADVRATQDYLRGVIDVAQAVGATVVGGPIYASVGRTWPLTPGERASAYDEIAEHLAPVVEHAVAAEVRLGVEPLNRFETSVVNTAAQAREIVDRVGSPALGVMLDTFHAAIEERDLAAGVATAGSALVHVQVCGSDRGAPGGDNIDWPRVLAALEGVGYHGPLCIESFTGDNATIAVAASIWRPLARSQDELATDGLAFLRGLT